MNKLLAEIRGFDRWFINFLNRSSLTILRMSLALIFIWFGALKPFGQSPAVDLIKNRLLVRSRCFYTHTRGLGDGDRGMSTHRATHSGRALSTRPSDAWNFLAVSTSSRDLLYKLSL